MQHYNRHGSQARPGPKIRLPELIIDREPLVIRGREYTRPTRGVAQDPILAIYAVGQIAEIVDVILAFASRSCLCRCALVCKSYHDIAIKHLWRRLPSAWPLLRLLGYASQAKVGHTVNWEFSTAPSQLRWETFDKFAKYVEIIAPQESLWSRGTIDFRDMVALGYNGIGEPDPRIDQCCDRCFISQVALGQLWQRQYSAVGTSHTPLIPNLEHLEFTFNYFRTLPEFFIPFLGPKLKSLSIRYHTCRRTIINQQHFETLQHLICQGLRELAEVEDEIPLESLEVSLESSVFLRGQCQGINEAFLSVLKRYKNLRRLKAPPFAHHDSLVSGIRHLDRLQSLSVIFESWEALSSFVKALGAQDPDIPVLELEHRYYWATPWSIPDALFHFRRLTSLSITTYGQAERIRIFRWRLPDVQIMSEAWPQLESLILCPQGFIPLGDLETFQYADLFPNLKNLVLPIDCIAAPSPLLPLQLRLRSLQLLETFTIEVHRDTTKHDIPALMKYAAQIGTPKTRIKLSGHAADCVCDLCTSVSECHRQELKPLVISSKMIKAFMASTL